MKAIETRYHGPTDKRGSRYSARDSDGNRVMLHPNDGNETANHKAAALALAIKMGWHPDNGQRGSSFCHTLQGGHTKRGMVWCFVDDDYQIDLREVGK